MARPSHSQQFLLSPTFLVSVAMVLFSLFSPAAQLSLSFSDCGANEVKEIRSTTCQADPCRVPLGGQVDIEMDFVPKSDAKKVNISIFASAFGFEVVIPLDDTDACIKDRLHCPVATGKRQTLRYFVQVKDTYYPLSGDVGLRLKAESGKSLACAKIFAELYERKDETHEEL